MVDRKINIAFNGFGRIGRNLIRTLIKDSKYTLLLLTQELRLMLELTCLSMILFTVTLMVRFHMS